MMTQPENSNQDAQENKQKTQKRKQKDEGSTETGKSEENIPISEKIIPSFPSQNKRLKKDNSLKSKTGLKNSVIKKVTKKVNSKSKKIEELDSINNFDSDETSEITDVAIVDVTMIDRETASLDSEQTGEEQSAMTTSPHPSTCKLQSQNDIKDGIECKDYTNLEKIDNTNKSKELNCSEIFKESSIVEMSATQIPLESDFKNSDFSSSSRTKQINENEDNKKIDLNKKEKIVSSDAEYNESSEEPKIMIDNGKENNDQTISNKQKSSLSDVKSDPKYPELSEEPKVITDKCRESNDQSVSNKRKIISNDAEYSELSEEPKAMIDNCKDSSIDQTISHKQNSSQNDLKSNPKYSELSEVPKAITDNCKESSDQTINNEQNSFQNDVKSNLLSEFETCQPISKQNILIQNQSSVNDLCQTILIQAKNLNECKLNESDHSENSVQVTNSNNDHPDEIQPVINSNNELISLVEGTPNQTNMTPIKPLILTAALKEEDKKESIPHASKDLGFNPVPEIPGSYGAHMKDPVFFENDDMDITDSQLCATEWAMTGDLLPENIHSKKSDCYLAKFKKAEKDGTQIVNELITELSRLNKLLLHYKREIDSVWKRKKVSSATSQQNVIKKRAPVQIVLGQFQ